MAFVQRLIDVTFALADGTQNTVSGLRVSCVISNAGPPSQGQMECAIFGLSLSTMNQLSTVGTQIDLIGKNFIAIQAGDAQSGMQTAFTGTITNAYVDAKAQPEVAFRVSAVGAQFANISAAKPTSVKGSADVSQMMSKLAQTAGFQFEGNGVSAKLANPYYAGTALQQIRKMAEDANIGWTVENNTLAIWSNGQARQGGLIVISPQTGMVGYPAFDSASVIVTTLFNAKIRQNVSITVQSDLTPACGQWNVINIVHEIESLVPHGKWFTHLEAARTGAQNTPYGAPNSSGDSGTSPDAGSNPDTSNGDGTQANSDGTGSDTSGSDNPSNSGSNPNGGASTGSNSGDEGASGGASTPNGSTSGGDIGSRPGIDQGGDPTNIAPKNGVGEPIELPDQVIAAPKK